jgi:hypothetical protein
MAISIHKARIKMDNFQDDGQFLNGKEGLVLKGAGLETRITA